MGGDNSKWDSLKAKAFSTPSEEVTQLEQKKKDGVRTDGPRNT